MKKIRVGAVNYLNTKPLLFGIRNHPVMNDIELVEDYPARIAQLLIEGSIDVGLVPVAATLKLSNWYLVGDYCIGCDGEVASVGIFSEVPMEKIKRVFLDYQSRTSVNLARLLMRDHWKKDVEWVGARGEDFRSGIQGTTAGVVIGDRALEQRQVSSYIYDLGKAWKDHTGLPFVFAAWISNKKLPEDFIQRFNMANSHGLAHIAAVIEENHYPIFDLEAYYRNFIDYRLDAPKKTAMGLFLSTISEWAKS